MIDRLFRCWAVAFGAAVVTAIAGLATGSTAILMTSTALSALSMIAIFAWSWRHP